MLDGLIYDIVLLSASFGFYLLYHIYIMIQVKRNPMNTVIGRNHHFRRLWTIQMVENKQSGILVVQTLRNMVNSSTLLASTSITLVVLLINILVSKSLTTILEDISIVGANNSKILIYKAFLLIIIFLFSFLNFATSIRYVTHLAFLLSVSPFYKECSVDYCNKSLSNGSNHYTVGVRSFYFAMCIILWFFDPIFMGIGTLLILYWLYIGDISHFVIPSKEKVKKSKKDIYDIENPESLNQDVPIPLKSLN